MSGRISPTWIKAAGVGWKLRRVTAGRMAADGRRRPDRARGRRDVRKDIVSVVVGGSETFGDKLVGCEMILLL